MSSHRLDIYCMAIGGTGMAPLACLLQEQGHRVRGTDGPLYPPMSALLERCGIEPAVGYDPRHLEPPPDLVVVGNAVRRDNPEALAAEGLGLPLLSMPQALARFFLDGRRPLVVAGTHGKTTTSAMAAWVYRQCGEDPGYLIGGLPRDLPASFHAGSGERFVVEGDEYNAAYFDRGAKFLHYRPETVLLTSVEYDHADLYPSPEALRGAYEQLIALLPETGLLVACGDTAEVRALAERAPCRVLLYGLGPGNDLRPVDGIEALEEGSRFRVAAGGWGGGREGAGGSGEGAGGEGVGGRHRGGESEPADAAGGDGADGDGEIEITLAMPGDHNVLNALAVWAAARHDGLPAARVAAALARFRGVKRRLEELGTARGVTVVDDFAHHPTAVGKTLAALSQRYPGRRLVALFEPRSLTAGRRFFHDGYRESFAGAARVLFAPIFHRGRLSSEEALDLEALAADLERSGIPATACASTGEVLERALAESLPRDVLVTMSSGAFDGLPHRLLAALGPGGATAAAPMTSRAGAESRAAS